MPINGSICKINIIDRTLPEIRSSLVRMSRLNILDLCWMLMSIGADILEADAELLAKMGRLPEGMAFMLRAHKASDIWECGRFRIKRLVLRRHLLEKDDIAELIKKEELNAVLEVRANTMAGIRRLEGLQDLKNFDAVRCVRVTGLEGLDTPKWLETVGFIREALGREIDICPGNRFSMGNAVALEAAACGVDHITASYSGYGRRGSFAALEVILPAIKLNRLGARRANPDILPLLDVQFAKCAGLKSSASFDNTGFTETMKWTSKLLI